MPQYFTPKLGLLVHGMEDGLDAAVRNWDRLDEGYSGVLWVQPDIIPDNSQLYDGALVAETTTGKVWRAEKQLDGSFARKWIKYPWMIMATKVETSFVEGVADHEWGFSDVVQYMCVNSSAADLLDTRIVVPIDAVYAIRMRCGWSGQGQYRSMKLAVDTVVDTVNTEVIVGSYAEFPYPQCNFNTTRKLFKGQRLAMGLWQNSGTTDVQLNARMEVAVVRPL